MEREKPRSALRVLAMDIGGGTQDILVYDSSLPIEDCTKLILPAPTVIVARQIEQATSAGQDVFLSGQLMGGGECVEAIKRHIRKGLHVYASRQAAMTIHDNIDRVHMLGVKIVKAKPDKAIRIRTGDVMLKQIKNALAGFGVSVPRTFAIAVLDHGYSPRMSNRLFRFKHWQKFIHEEGRLDALAYSRPPPYLTRMRAIKKKLPDALVMDTCAAAVCGTLCDEEARRHSMRHGLVVVNVGNQHTLGMKVYRGRVYGLFEHHTVCLDKRKIRRLVAGLISGKLKHEDVFDDGGHGCVMSAKPPRSANFEFAAVVGPMRSLAEGLGYYFAAPHGDVMLTGCFGLVEAYKKLFGV